ncbi:MAG: CvpA family protein [Corallococcus sp.]|nr:CvpA family protein [Corallococcus sp.]
MKLDMIMLIITIVPLVIGLLLGFLRGSRRSVLRLLLVILCVVCAFCLKDVVADKLLDFEIDGKTLQEIVVSFLPPELSEMSDTLTPIVFMIVSAVSFLLIFLALQFVTWLIIYPLCKLFVKKGKKKHGIIGGVVGLVQGAAVALVLVVMCNGILLNVGKVTEVANSAVAQTNTAAESPRDDDPEQDLFKQISDMLDEYMQSKYCQAISPMSSKVFDFVASVKLQDGNKLTLSGQIDALSGLVKMAEALQTIQDLDLYGGFTGDLADGLANVFATLDEINSSLSTESKQTINEIVSVVADAYLQDLPIDIDLTVIDFETIDFGKEGEVITELASYKGKDIESLTEEDAKNIVNTVVESDIILPLLSSSDDFTLNLNNEQKEYANRVIDDLADDPEVEIDDEKLNMLIKFFGINDSQGGSGVTTPPAGTDTPTDTTTPSEKDPSETETPTETEDTSKT